MSVSSVQMPCRSGSPQGVFSAVAGAAVTEAAGAWAATLVMDAAMPTPAAAAMATIIVERRIRSRMMIT